MIEFMFVVKNFQRLLTSILLWCRTHRWRTGIALLLSLILVLDLAFPPPLPKAQAGMLVLARDGSPLRGWPDGDGVWRIPVQPEQVSPYYLQALLNYEDRWFYWHLGVNPLALVRASWQWLRHGEIISGGSTLSMQVARAIEPMPHSVSGKLRQIWRAWQIEARLSKREILTLYLNHAPMGGIIEGVEMASRSYLGKSAAQLSQAEAALLVVLPQAPSRWRPDRHPQRAQQARDKVLRRMAEHRIWTEADVADGLIEKVAATPPKLAWLAPLAAERLHQQARWQARQQRGAQEIIHSTIDRDLQVMLERMLADRVSQLPRHVSMAALVVDSKSMEVLAYAGSADFSDARRFSHVDMVRGIRSPGSTLKPFLYAMALDEGLIHSESLLADTPQSFHGYDPGNFQANFSGPVSVADALQRSLNVPAVDLLDRLGAARFHAKLANAGLTLRLPKDATPNLSLILGGAGTNLEQLVGAYRSLAMAGKAAAPRITTNEAFKESHMMSPGAAYIIRSILEAGGNPDQAFIEQAGPRLAWKTGTSYGFRDAWAVGVVDSYTLGVWIGRPDGTPNPGFFGANIAAPLLQQIAYALPKRGELNRQRPASVSTASICWPLGYAADQTAPEHCHQKRSAWVLAQTLPPTLPDRLRSRGLLETIWLDPQTGLRTTPQCQPQAQALKIAHWPALLEAWLTIDERKRYGISQAQQWQADCAQAQTSQQVRLIGLQTGSRVRPVPGQKQVRLSLEAVGGQGQHYWLLDGKLVWRSANHKAGNLLIDSAGQHSIAMIDSAGHYASIDFWADL